MPLEIRRLHLAGLQGVDGRRWPVHGFVVTHDGGAVLVYTGVGGPERMLDDRRVVNRSVADALADLDMSPADIGLVINTHLHFDHCGQNAVFRHAPIYVQRAELGRAQCESPELWDWLGFMDARFELLDGDAEVLPGLEVIATPGHAAGHQCVLVRADGGAFDLLIGDAAYTPRVYADPVPGPGPGAFLPPHRRPAPRTEITMQVIAEAGVFTPPDGDAPNHWVVHLNSDDLSLGTYSIPAGGQDDQTPHTEDEVYVVQAGRATLVTTSGIADLGPGSVVFVPAGERHRFTEVSEDLALLVVFAPPYESRAAG